MPQNNKAGWKSLHPAIDFLEKSVSVIDMVDVACTGQSVATLALPIFNGVVEWLGIGQFEHVPLAVFVLGRVEHDGIPIEAA